MVVRFTWQPREWREAYLLCNTDQARAAGRASMGGLVAGIMLTGGAVDSICSLRHSRGLALHDRLLPVLLLVCAFAILASAARLFTRRRDRYRKMPAIPAGEQQVIFHELGWNTTALTGSIESEPVRPWSAFYGYRLGHRVLAFQIAGRVTAGIPLRALTADQAGWLKRIIDRKTRTVPGETAAETLPGAATRGAKQPELASAGRQSS